MEKPLTLGENVRSIKNITVLPAAANGPRGTLLLALLQFELTTPAGREPESVTLSVRAEELETLAIHLLRQARAIQRNLQPRGPKQ